MVGILVHGDNHFIVSGTMPDRTTAVDLLRHWSFIEIGAATPEHLIPYSIVTREFRENLRWAVVVAGETPVSHAVGELLRELAARGVEIYHVKGSSPGPPESPGR